MKNTSSTLPAGEGGVSHYQELRALTEELDMKGLRQKAKEMSPETIKEKIDRLNRRIKLISMSHEVDVVVDPNVSTWACVRVPKKQVLSDGTIEETNYFRYMVVMPYEHIAIEDEQFLLGELRHELGHAFYTSWRVLSELIEQSEKEGYPKEAMGSLLNCLEDPRMEHVVSLTPQESHVRKWFWAKNKAFVLPGIGNNIAKGHPASQLDFLIKLYSLWQLHKKNAEADEVLPWNAIDELDPDVQRLWNEKVLPALEKIVGLGKYDTPKMRASDVQEAVLDVFWPAKKEILDIHGNPPPSDGNGEGGEGGEGQGSGQPDGDDQFPSNPDDIDNLPPEVQQALKKAIENYNQQIEQKKKEAEEQKKKAEEANRKIDDEQSKRLQRKDGMRDPEKRRTYNKLRREAKVVEHRIKRLFEKYFPKISFPRETFGLKGKKYNAREHLKRYGTGLEKPMAIPNVPEKSGFVLQIIVDVSGSMYHGRIDEVIKTVIGILEASVEYPIHIEILASDTDHGGIDPKYILKAFDESYGGAEGGKIKERLVATLNSSNYGGGNEDAKSLQWAIPRIEKKKKDLSADYEKLATLTIFLSDAEMEGQQDPDVVNALRKKIPILGGCIEPNPKIQASVQAAYGPIGEGSFCPDSLRQFPVEFEKILRKKIRKMFR